jgi:hypothetical protein
MHLEVNLDYLNNILNSTVSSQSDRYVMSETPQSILRKYTCIIDKTGDLNQYANIVKVDKKGRMCVDQQTDPSVLFYRQPAIHSNI